MFKVGKDESQIDKHTFSRNICSIWLLFLAPLAAHGRFFWYQNSKASPPQKKKNAQADRTLRGGLREMAESFDLR